jgi:hypothetical protein
MARTIKNHLEIVYIILWVTLGVIHFSLLYYGYGLLNSIAFADSLVFNLLFALIGAASGLWSATLTSGQKFGELALPPFRSADNLCLDIEVISF